MKYTKELAISFFCTRNEYISGSLHECLKQYFAFGLSRKYKFDLFFVFDQGVKYQYYDLLELESHDNINKVVIHSLELSDKNNLYIKSGHSRELYEKHGKPALGLSTGPNNSFFGGMRFLGKKNYKNYLLLETDTRPVKYFWFDLLYKYCIEEDFLIAGSFYDGRQHIPESYGWKYHLNGVAIYKNSDLFKSLLIETFKTIKRLSRQGKHDHFVNYDIAIYYTINASDKNRKKYSGAKNTKIISNLSLGIDKKTKESNICRQNEDLIILHQKL